MATDVTVLCFGPLRDAAGERRFTFALDDPSVDSAWDALVAAAPAAAALRESVRVAVNRTYTAWSAPVAGGDEIAFIPPVAGG